MKVATLTPTFRNRPRLTSLRVLLPAVSLASFLLASSGPAWGQHRIAGLVFERQAEQKIPLKGARVEAWAPDGSHVLAQAWTDALGRYAISNLAAERVTLTVTQSGYYPLYGNGHRDGMVVVCLASGDCALVDFEMVREGVLEIRVIDQIGHPIEDVLFTVTPLDEADLARPPSRRKRTLLRRCSKQGQCVVPGMAPGRYLIRGESRKRGAVTIEAGAVEVEFEPRQEMLTVQLVLPVIRKYRVSGRILGLGTSEAARSMVILETAVPAERHPTAFRPTGAMVDRDGSFAFNSIPAGEYWLKLVPPEDSDIVTSRPGVRLGKVSVKEDVGGLVFHAPPINPH